MKREREGKDWKGKGVRERGRERDGRRRDYSFTMSNYRKTERGCSREREAGSKDPEPLSKRWVFGVLVGSLCSGFASIAV